MTVEELGEVFESAEAPSVSDLSGDLRETVLAGPGALRLRRVRDIVNTPLNPWVGKRIECTRPEGGRGSNILSVGPKEVSVAEFEAYVGESVYDGDPAVVLDYDTGKNPAPVRRTVDEIRLTDHGRVIGAGRTEVSGKYRLLFYFTGRIKSPDREG